MSGNDSELHNSLVKAGLEKMTTLRDLQAGMLQALDEINERNEKIENLQSTVKDQQIAIVNLTQELKMLKAVLNNPLSQLEDTELLPHMKRIAISAAPVDQSNDARSVSFPKNPLYVI